MHVACKYTSILLRIKKKHCSVYAILWDGKNVHAVLCESAINTVCLTRSWLNMQIVATQMCIMNAIRNESSIACIQIIE